MFESLRQLLAGLVSGKELKYLDEIGMRPPLFDLEEPQHHHDFVRVEDENLYVFLPFFYVFYQAEFCRVLNPGDSLFATCKLRLARWI